MWSWIGCCQLMSLFEQHILTKQQSWHVHAHSKGPVAQYTVTQATQLNVDIILPME